MTQLWRSIYIAIRKEYLTNTNCFSWIESTFLGYIVWNFHS